MYIDRSQVVLGEQAGYLWTWWKQDTLPVLDPLADWHVETSNDRNFLAKLSVLSHQEAEKRLQAGHQAYVAYIGDVIVAYGWTAHNSAAFGSPSVHFTVPAGDLYLYHFVTLLPWRGRGCYPRLLQTIIQRESSGVERFWIIHQLKNIASQRGIARAGFQIAIGVFSTRDNGLVLVPERHPERALAGSKLLGLPLLQ